MKRDAYLEKKGQSMRSPGILQREHFIKQVNAQELEQTPFLTRLRLLHLVGVCHYSVSQSPRQSTEGLLCSPGSFLLEFKGKPSTSRPGAAAGLAEPSWWAWASPFSTLASVSFLGVNRMDSLGLTSCLPWGRLL